MNKGRTLSLSLILSFLFSCILSPFIVLVCAEQAGAVQNEQTEAGFDQGYLQYLSGLEEKPNGADVIELEGESGEILSGETETIQNSRFSAGYALRTQEGSKTEWSFHVQTSGIYTFSFTVTTEAAKKSSAQRTMLIDGNLLFDELAEITFFRYWEDVVDDGFEADASGNHLRPSSNAADRLETQTLSCDNGEDYQFYLEAGEHSLTLEAIKELLVVDQITISGYQKLPTYAEKKEEYQKSGYQEIADANLTIEAEYCSGKSDYSIYPLFDRTSGKTSPQSTKALLLNTIGSTHWQSVGQWISWTADVAESGLYQLSFHYLQDSLRGVFVSRELQIDGEVPFAEASHLRFSYDNKWQMQTLSDEEGDPYLFYLEKGKHTIRMRVVLGELYEVVEQVSSSLTELNTIYRSILSITGSSPDIYRDYDFEHIIPEVLENMKQQSDLLKDTARKLQKLTGEKGEMLSMLETMYFQLDKMLLKPYEIAKQFTTFKSNISSLGDWIYKISNQPLLLDYIVLSGERAELPEADSNFLEGLWFNTQLFFNSFVVDYNTVQTQEGGEPLEVWVPTGRDQWRIISNLSDNSFRKQTNIPVTVKLVAPTALLPSTLSGRGPDVALSNAQNIPVDYALRNAVLDLSDFSDYKNIAGRFMESALVPFRYQSKTYGLPENQTWPMMFCRTDVLDEMGIEPPQTWTDVLSAIPVIKRKNMEFGMIVGYQGYLQLLYQKGGSLYKEDGYHTALESNEAISAFEQLCNLFTQYKLPIEYNAANRFRSGEMPIIIADYSFYNQLMVFSPEIGGLWEMLPIPGERQEDGTVNHLAVSTTTAAIILKSTEKKEQAWEYLKWWTSDTVQTEFGVEMEAILGPSAKQPTANIAALSELPWTVKEYSNLHTQQESSTGIPIVPGYYQAERLIGFAFNDVYNDNTNPSDELENILNSIDTELERKNQEFVLRNK